MNQTRTVTIRLSKDVELALRNSLPNRGGLLGRFIEEAIAEKLKREFGVEVKHRKFRELIEIKK